ncbi:MAG: histidine kinase [Clostridia bacterium]|nr:histidine kinase [Clostridia bacterium]
MLSMLVNLLYRVGFMIMLALIFSWAKAFRNIFSKEKPTLRDKIIMGIFFGSLSIVGTYTGIEVQGAISNTRVIGAAVGGLLGGPFVGLLAGMIGGGHRFLIDIGGFTAVSCGLATLLEGLIAGLCHKKFKESKDPVPFALAVGIVIEAFQMLFILMVAKPYPAALALVKIVGVPMTINNAIGIAIFIMIIENIRKISSVEATYRSKQSLIIAGKTLQYFKSGLTSESAQKSAEVIYKSGDFDAVAITDKKRILAHIGEGSDHHLAGRDCKTKVTFDALTSGEMNIAYDKTGIGCDDHTCKLSSAIVMPLNDGIEVRGALKLYKTSDMISEHDIELARGLGNIFSSQLELARLEENEMQTMKAEMRALQAQINPHFLFNAINTIVSLVRTSPESARSLLLHLSDFFRMNMQNSKDMITVKEEIQRIRAYLKIEKARFGEKLNVAYELEGDLEDEIPPLIIQPLVENAVKHGVNKSIDGGKVLIRVKEHEEAIVISVIDNGVGMSDVALKKIQHYDEECGIGFSNVYKRLKTLYGNRAQLTVQSKIGQGTQVDIKIPRMAKEVIA